MASIYEIVGRQIQKDNIRYFNELVDKSGYSEPILSDIQMLNAVKSAFCEIRGIAPARLITKNHDREASRNRQLCIAVCYKLYSPNSMNREIMQGLSKSLNVALSRLLNINPKKIGGKIKNSLFYYSHVPDFRKVVDDICSNISDNASLYEQSICQERN